MLRQIVDRLTRTGPDLEDEALLKRELSKAWEQKAYAVVEDGVVRSVERDGQMVTLREAVEKTEKRLRSAEPSDVLTLYTSRYPNEADISFDRGQEACTWFLYKAYLIAGYPSSQARKCARRSYDHEYYNHIAPLEKVPGMKFSIGIAFYYTDDYEGLVVPTVGIEGKAPCDLVRRARYGDVDPSPGDKAVREIGTAFERAD